MGGGEKKKEKKQQLQKRRQKQLLNEWKKGIDQSLKPFCFEKVVSKKGGKKKTKNLGENQK